MQEKRSETAYQLTGNWLKLAPKDAALLVNYGILAQQFGHQSEAEESWHNALRVDPSRVEADLFLASALERQAQPEAAVVHYEAYLAKMAQRPAASLPPPATLISVALKAADCNTRANHAEKALQFYKMARTLAAQTHEEKLESVADIAEALLDTKLGQAQKALSLYQRALQLDATLDDRRNSAVDWYMYALFLRDSGFPIRLAYASVLKSQALLSSDSNSQQAVAIGGLRKDLEKQLGPEASRILRNSEPLQQEAMVLKP